MNESDTRPPQLRKPIFGTLSLIVPVLGLAIAYWLGINAPPSTGDNWNSLIIFAFYGVLSVLCGFVLAAIGAIRREKPGFLCWLGLVLNLIPILWFVSKAGILPTRLG